MACPFIQNPVEEGARIVRAVLCRKRVFRDRQNPFEFPDEVLYKRYRFSAQGLGYICQLLEPHVGNVTSRSRALTVPQIVCVALRFFATGTFMYAVGDAENLTGFPRVIGAVDCTHIPISASLGDNEADYINRKSFHSLNIQMTCDHQMMITSLDAKWPGSVHDSRIFRESALCRTLEQGQFNGVLLGDRGYACQPFLLTPYPDPGAGPQTRFNVALSRTRVRIEMTFGLIKARFTCLRGLRVVPDRACRIIAACCILHNIATIRRERAPPLHPPPPDVVDPITLDYPSGRAVREAITDQFFS